MVSKIDTIYRTVLADLCTIDLMRKCSVGKVTPWRNRHEPVPEIEHVRHTSTSTGSSECMVNYGICLHHRNDWVRVVEPFIADYFRLPYCKKPWTAFCLKYGDITPTSSSEATWTKKKQSDVELCRKLYPTSDPGFLDQKHAPKTTSTLAVTASVTWRFYGITIHVCDTQPLFAMETKISKS